MQELHVAMDGVRYIVDRIEGDLAVCERDDLEFFDIPLEKLPEGTKAGDCLVFDGEWRIDSDETERRKARIEKKMRDLFI